MPIGSKQNQNPDDADQGDGQDDELPDWMLTPKFAVVIAIFLLSTLLPAAIGLTIMVMSIADSNMFTGDENSNPDCYVSWQKAPLVLGYKGIHRADKDLERYRKAHASLAKRTMYTLEQCPMQACSKKDTNKYHMQMRRYIGARQRAIRDLAQNYGRPGLDQGMDLFHDWQDVEFEIDLRTRMKADWLNMGDMRRVGQFLNMVEARKSPTPCIHSQAEPG